VAHGSNVTFKVVIEDLDNDPIPAHVFKVDYAPAGLTMDPVTGDVSWTPTGPMFGPAVDNHWSIGVDGIPGDQHVAGTARVADPGRSIALLRTVNGFGTVPRRGLRIGDFDGDGDSEMLVLGGGTVQEYASTGVGYEIVWAYPFAVGKGAPLALATRDVDDDGKREIFLAGNRTLTKLDGVTRRPVVTVTLEGPVSCADIEVTDLTNDGPDELVCLAKDESGDGKVMVFAASDLSLIQQSDKLISLRGEVLAIGNVDADPALEIVTANGNVYDGATLAMEWTRASFGDDVAVGDVTGDGVADIVAAADGSRIDVYSATQKTRLLLIPFSARGVLLANLDAGPALEILSSDGSAIEAFHYDAAGATTLFRLEGGGLPDSGVLGFGNVDGDAERELVVCAALPYVIGLDAPRTIDWPDVANLPFGTTGPFFGGTLARDALGRRALLFATGHGADARIIELSPASGRLTVSPPLAQTQAQTAPFVVADYDNDLVDEVLMAPDVDNKPKHFAYDFFASSLEWSSPFQNELEYVVAVAAADVTGDGHADLLSLNRLGRLTVFDVFGGTLVGQADVLADGVDITLANVDSDPRLEVIAAAKGRVVVLDVATNPFSVTTLSSYTSPNELRDVATGDVDGDGKLEVLALGVLRGSNEHARIERLTTGLARLGAIATQVVGNQVMLERSTVPRKNLLVAATNGDDVSGPVVASFDALSGSEVWRSPGLLGAIAPNSLSYVDLPGDNRQRLAFGTTIGMYLTQ
jgi:hypothetical protein